VIGAAGTSQIMEPVKLVGVLVMMSMEPTWWSTSAASSTQAGEPLCHTSQLGERLDDEDVGFVYGMAEFSAAKEPFRYGEAFRAFRFDLPWSPRRSRSSARREARSQPPSAVIIRPSASAWLRRRLPSHWAVKAQSNARSFLGPSGRPAAVARHLAALWYCAQACLASR